ncbi:MAG: DUF6144 family protein [Anaerolineae bacterium]
MTDKQDFERAWLAKFARGVQNLAGDETRRQLMAGSELLSSDSPREEVIRWTANAMRHLVTMMSEEERKAIMVDCACEYPRSSLRNIRELYDPSAGNINLAHRMLQAQFETFLADTLRLEDRLLQKIAGKGWGLAGVLRGETIIATKIPKSGQLADYLKESDPHRKRQIYCHCPRIRDVLSRPSPPWPKALAKTYCTCGAGFYKGIWEEIVQAPVGVNVLESVLMGDEVCKIAIHLPSRAA